MPELLELLETMRAEDASVQRLFSTENDGRGVRSMRRDDPRYQRAFAEALSLYSGVVEGRAPMYRLQEAMSTSDFPLLMGDIIDRSLLGYYNEWPTAWPMIANRATVRDFRTVRRFVLDGAEGVLPVVPQGSEYPEASLIDAKYEYAVNKRGRRVPFLWEAFVNDDLDALRRTPERLAKAARMSEEFFATGLYAASTGPNATFFSAGNANLVPTGTVGGNKLSTTSLQAGFTLLWGQKDKDNNPIYAGQVRLVVPPQLAVAARNILNATEIRVATGGGTTTDQITAKNWMAGEIVQLVVNPWLPIVTTAGTGATAWYLFADPGMGRPALEVGFLRGHETPEMFLKSPNATRIGGGPVAAEDGDFETDGIAYKVRHVYGGSLVEPKAGIASDGTT
jgi:hypothetical protein